MDANPPMDHTPNHLSKTVTNPDVVRNICIIGGGAAGLAALKVIAETEEYKVGSWKPTLFERRDNVGGVWLPAPPTDDPPLSPLYDSLTTNLPHPVMGYESFLFPPSTPLFPPAKVVLKYLEDFVSHFALGDRIRLNSDVQEVHWDALESKWKVKTSNGEALDFDFVIVSNGHFNKPRYPTAPGLESWLKDGRASHSAYYRRPENLGDVVLIVGNGPSGRDISTEMCQAAKMVIHSVPGATTHQVGNLKTKGRVMEFRDEGQVLFEDGTVESGIDHCILATGYEIDFSFFSNAQQGMPPPVPPLPPKLYNSSLHVFPLARQILPIQSEFPVHTAAFLGLLRDVAPMPLIEAQVRAVCRVFRHPESLDIEQEGVDILSRYEELKEKYGGDEAMIASAWHRSGGNQQFDYRDQLNKFAEPDVDRKVGAWTKEMFAKSDELRAEWRDLESTGEADEWLKGVGENGLQDWIELMRKVLRRAEERQGRETKGRACCVQ